MSKIIRREGGAVHKGTRERAKGGYRLSCTGRLVSYADYKRTKRAVNCARCGGG